MKKHINYLCLQATRQGQASYTHVNEIIKGLRKRGWNVTLYEPVYIKKRNVLGVVKRFFEFIRVQIHLLFNIRKGILYIRSHFAAFPTSFIAKLLGIPVIQEVNGPYEDLFIAWPWTCHFKRLFKLLIRIQLRWANSIIVVTENLKEWVYKETHNSEIYVIPNGANIDLFKPNTKSNIEITKPYAIFFGALAPWQGIETIVEAAKSSLWPINVNLLIVGDGVEKKIVEREAKENSRIIYLGTIPYEEIPGLVSNSMVSLCAMNNIGNRMGTGLFPLKLFESLSCSVPVIVTNSPGQADLIRKYDCGIVIEPENPNELASAVAYIYEHIESGTQMGRRGHDAVILEHSWDRRADDTEKVILNCINSK